MPSYRVNVYRSGHPVFEHVIDHVVEVGRRDVLKNEPAPITIYRKDGVAKLIVADETETEITRRWFRLSAVVDGQVLIENLNERIRVPLSHDNAVAIGERRIIDNEILIELGGELAMRVVPLKGNNFNESDRRDSKLNNDEFRSLMTVPPSPGQDDATLVPTIAIRQLAAPDAHEVAKMLRLALQVVHKAAGSDAFFQSAVAAAAQIVELDRAVVLIRTDAEGVTEIAKNSVSVNDWCVVAEHLRPGVNRTSLGSISRTVLQQVIDTATTVIHDPMKRNTWLDSEGADNPPSLMSVCCATASPILNRDRAVIGVLYGDRMSDQFDSSKSGISDLEATLMEVLAGSVAGGIARKSEERLRGTLSEFFSPKVADLLANHPELMDGQDAEVSVLFCDVRGFSSVTEKLGPQKAIEWINDVMSELSQCVIDRDGVLVDYVGDELLAMWGAPGAQPDHACRALDAARAMLNAIEILRVRWADVLPQRFGAGIGVNTGPARVGNVGSRQKFKYGAIGNTVNVGSRLQSATKQVGVDCIASGDTILAAKQVAQCRRIAKLAVVGIDQAMDVYEVVCAPSETWTHLSKNYELALDDYEAERFGEAARRIGELVQKHPQDRPCKKLLGRAVKELDEPAECFSPVWHLATK